MRPQSCKAKGRRLQQRVVADLLRRFPELTADDVRSTSMGSGGEDVLLSPRAQSLVPFSFEAKNQERLNIWASLEQASRNARVGREPCVVFKKNGTDLFAAVRWSKLLSLMGATSSLSPPRCSSDGGALATTNLRERLCALRSAVDAFEEELAFSPPAPASSSPSSTRSSPNSASPPLARPRASKKKSEGRGKNATSRIEQGETT